MTTSTPSGDHRRAVFAAMKGVKSGPMDFIKNFKGTHDAAETTSPGGVSTKIWYDTRTLAASASENLDLNGGLVDERGNGVNFAKIHAIYVKPSAANTNKVVVGGAAANTFQGPFADVSDAIKVGPGRVFSEDSTSGWVVTANTGDILKIANDAGGSSVTYDIVLMGE